MCCDLTMEFIIAYTPLVSKLSLLRDFSACVFICRVSSLPFGDKWMQEHFNHLVSNITVTDFYLLYAKIESLGDQKTEKRKEQNKILKSLEIHIITYFLPYFQPFSPSFPLFPSTLFPLLSPFFFLFLLSYIPSFIPSILPFSILLSFSSNFPSFFPFFFNPFPPSFSLFPPFIHVFLPLSSLFFFIYSFLTLSHCLSLTTGLAKKSFDSLKFIIWPRLALNSCCNKSGSFFLKLQLSTHI